MSTADGVAARFDGFCARCNQGINRGDRVVKTHRDEYIHVRCAAGQDDG